jgi:hypothetical protein
MFSKTRCWLLALLCTSACTYSQTVTDSLPGKAQWATGRPSFFIQAGPMLNYVRRTTIDPTGTFGYSAGIGTRKQISENLFIQLSVSYQHKRFEHMQTTVYEPLIRGGVQLDTRANFDEIECSILCGASLPHLEAGAGLAPSYMIHSLLNQNVTSVPPGSTTMQYQQMQNIYNKTDNPYTAYFYLTNVSPCLYVAYPLNNCLKIAYYFSFELVKNPIEPYSYIQPYQFIQNKITLILKIPTHEKNRIY